MSNTTDDLSGLTSEVLEHDSREKRALSILLDRHTSVQDKLFVQRLEMGGTESFIGSVTLEWFSEKVRFASQLPLFQEKLDTETGKVIIDKSTINDVLQRPIDYTRESVLAQYLGGRPRHKFPAVLVVVSQS